MVFAKLIKGYYLMSLPEVTPVPYDRLITQVSALFKDETNTDRSDCIRSETNWVCVQHNAGDSKEDS